MKIIKSYIVVLNITLIILGGCSFQHGFLASVFTLSPESRLPNWLELPKNYSRDALNIQLWYFTPLFADSRVIVKVIDRRTDNVLIELQGTNRYHPYSEQKGITNYPIYEIISIKNIDEVIEHRQSGDIVFITDDSKLIDMIKKKTPISGLLNIDVFSIFLVQLDRLRFLS